MIESTNATGLSQTDEASVVLLGVKGGPAIRPGTNMPTSHLLKFAGKNILIDAGLGVTRAVCDQDVPLSDIDLIFITHLHSDHYLELGPFLHTAWTAGLNKPISVIGPSGLNAYWNGFCEAMRFDIDLRIKDEGRCDFESLAALTPLSEGAFDNQLGLTITAMKNDHPPIKESFALRFEANGKSVVFSGDTAFMETMSDFAKDADLLIHEAMLKSGVEALVARMTNGDERLHTHILRSHTDAVDVGKIARAADVKALALNHFVPDSDPDFPERDWKEAVRQHWDGPLYIGRDSMKIPF